MKATKAAPNAANPGKEWLKTPYANLIRYVPSGTYYARLRVKGKLIRRSLDTDVLSVAKLRLADFEKQERQRSESSEAVACGKMTVGVTRAFVATPYRSASTASSPLTQFSRAANA